MSNWKSSDNLTDREVRQLLAGALSEITTLRRTCAILGALYLIREGVLPQPPEEVRESMHEGLRLFLDGVLEDDDDEERVIRVHHFEEHQRN